jgi:hypothetical protein
LKTEKKEMNSNCNNEEKNVMNFPKWICKVIGSIERFSIDFGEQTCHRQDLQLPPYPLVDDKGLIKSTKSMSSLIVENSCMRDYRKTGYQVHSIYHHGTKDYPESRLAIIWVSYSVSNIFVSVQQIWCSLIKISQWRRLFKDTPLSTATWKFKIPSIIQNCLI